MSITLRSVKGTALTHAELDQNFIDLRDLPTGTVYPSASNVGIKVDTASPDWAWEDLVGTLFVDESDLANAAVFTNFIGNIKARQFINEQTDVAYVDFHIPHNYVEGTELYIHVHWSHSNTNVTGGSVTWGIDATYAKGHQQSAFQAPITVAISQNANTTQYTHMIAEGPLTTPGGAAGQFDTAIIQTDGVINCRVFLDSNDLTVSSGVKPDPFVHFVDIHYQSRGFGTKNKSPDFFT